MSGWAPFRTENHHTPFSWGGSPAGYLGPAAALLPEGVLLTVDSRHTSRRSKALGGRSQAKSIVNGEFFFVGTKILTGYAQIISTPQRARKTAKMKRMRITNSLSCKHMLLCGSVWLIGGSHGSQGVEGKLLDPHACSTPASVFQPPTQEPRAL